MSARLSTKVNSHRSGTEPERRGIFVLSVILAFVGLITAVMGLVVYIGAREKRVANASARSLACQPSTNEGNGHRD